MTPRPAPVPGSRGAGAGAEERLALAALGVLLVVTALWWALALWPPPAGAPAWVQAARAVCFGAHETGLPDAGGWLLLAGEPLGMGLALYVMARGPLRRGLRALAAGPAGRAVLALACTGVLAGVGAAAWRVADAYAAPAPRPPLPAAALRSVNHAAPPLRLVDQHGDPLTLDRFRGRPVLVTFAYANCATVCPLLVHDALAVQRHAEPRPALVVVTLDPWRDTPSRLPHMARAWGLGADAYVAGGGVDEVLPVLAAWKVAVQRDGRTGEVAHPPVTFVLDAAGRVRFAGTGTRAELSAGLAHLRRPR